jgi:hypothetical protein
MMEMLEILWDMVWKVEVAYITFLLGIGVAAVLVMGLDHK